MTHVVALDPQRHEGQIEMLLQLVERSGPAVVIIGAFLAVTIEGLLCVLGDRLVKTPLVAPLGHANLHPRPPCLADPLLVQPWIMGQTRHQHL